MKYTDPSGHSWFSKLWDKIGTYVIAVVVAVIAVYTGGLALGAMGYGSVGAAINAGAYGAIAVSGAVGGFAAGVSAGLLSGASLGDSLAMGFKGAAYGAIGAVTAGYIGGISSGAIRASLHGITRAAISKAQGGKWSAGFWSGFASSALAPLASSASTFEGKVAMSAIVGGTASELGGGKFANGAVTGAFVMLYNDMAHGSVAMNRKRQALLAGAKDGHLTLEEANNWYVYGGGKMVLVDGTRLKYELTGGVTDQGNFSAKVTGEDWAVYGQVTVSSKTGGIFQDSYGFEMHGSPLRDFLTIIGRSVAGSVGTPYIIRPVYDGSWRNQ